MFALGGASGYSGIPARVTDGPLNTGVTGVAMPYLASVRYGRMNITENFMAEMEGLRRNEDVVIRSERGMEIGIIASEVTLTDRTDIKGLGVILRKATDEDRRVMREIEVLREPEEMQFCRQCIRERNLPMKLAEVEHLFGGDKIIYYFLADGRVDFRELVKDLARKYRTRIEMRQIGVRDEAKLLSDYEHCGRELCCRSFINNLEPVTMRMAKLQKTTLDPTKISGHCGRLMCCLRFEDEVYTELKRRLPNRSMWVRTAEHEGKVIDFNVLAQTVIIMNGQGDRATVRLDDIVERRPINAPSGSGSKPRREGRDARSPEGAGTDGGASDTDTVDPDQDSDEHGSAQAPA